jgi:hypothetical protein
VATTFNRLLAPPHRLCAQEFTRDTESGRAVLCCPLCAWRFELPAGVAPDQTGKTNERVKCPVCQWHDWAVLAEHWLEVP